MSATKAVAPMTPAQRAALLHLARALKRTALRRAAERAMAAPPMKEKPLI